MTQKDFEALCRRLNPSPWQQRVLHEELADYPWHTGTPTEEGYYLVQLRGYYYKDTIGKIVAKWERNRWRTIHGGLYRNLEEDIKAWMPIELNKETD